MLMGQGRLNVFVDGGHMIHAEQSLSGQGSK